MSAKSGKLLFWAPRILSVIFIAFLSLFALDVFNEHLGFWPTIFGLGMHLIPSIALIAVLILAWRREWIGSMLFAAAGLFHVIWAAFVPRPWSFSQRYISILTIAGPAFIIAILFLFNWKKHDELRTLVH